MKSAQRAKTSPAQRGASTIAAIFAAIIALLAATFGLHLAPMATNLRFVASGSQPAAAAQSTAQRAEPVANSGSPKNSPTAGTPQSPPNNVELAAVVAAAPPSHATPQSLADENLSGTSAAGELAQLQILGNQLQSDIAALPVDNPPSNSYLTVPAWALSQRIDQLSDVAISNSTIDAASIPDLSGDYLSVNGGAVAGMTTFGGIVGIGTSTPEDSNTGASLVVDGNSPIETFSNYANGIAMYTSNDADFRAPYLNFYKSRGTQTAPTPVRYTGYEEDSIGGINFGGWDGSEYFPGAAAIYTNTDENWTPTAHGAHVAIYFTRLGASTENEMVQFGGLDASGVDGNDTLFYWPVNFFSNSYTGLKLSADGNGGVDVSRGDGTSGADFDVLGSIGVGSTSPYSLLSISNSASTAANTPLLTIASTTGGTSTSTLITMLANGKIGVGTNNPTSTVDIRSPDGNALQIGSGPANSTGYSIATVRANASLRFAGFNLGSLWFEGTADNYTSEQPGAGITSHTEDVGSFNWQVDPAADLYFWTTPIVSGGVPIQRMFIDANGNIGMGTLGLETPPPAKLYLDADNGDTNTNVFVVASSTANATTTLFNVTNAGNATLAGSLTQNSDQRLKTNIQSLDASASLVAIEALNPVSYQWLGNIFGTGQQIGFIAQQIQQQFPQLVSTTSPTALTPNGTLGLNYSGLIAPIVGAIQDIASISGDFETNLIKWLGNASNGIQDLFANNIYATKLSADDVIANQELCVGDGSTDPSPICITKSQLAAILVAAGIQTSPESVTSSWVGDTAATASTSAATDTPPIIQINGDNPATVQVGATYTDLGAQITGPEQDLNFGITASVDGGATTTVSAIQIDTALAGIHTITYSAVDQNGIAGYATRSVVVADNDATTSLQAATSTS